MKRNTCLLLLAGALCFAACGRHPADLVDPKTRDPNPDALTPADSALIRNFKGIDFIYEAIDNLFGKHVTAERGLVAYDSLWQSGLFAYLIDYIGGFDPRLLKTRADSFAFYINVYNGQRES